MQKDQYIWEAEVRYNETDFQGIVSNSNYLIYMTHARNKHIEALGIDLYAARENGADFVLVHTDIAFKAPLKGGDKFIVTSNVRPNGRVRIGFTQEVIRKSDGKVVAVATNTCVCLDAKTGRPIMPEFLRKALREACCEEE